MHGNVASAYLGEEMLLRLCVSLVIAAYQLQIMVANKPRGQIGFPWDLPLQHNGRGELAAFIASK